MAASGFKIGDAFISVGAKLNEKAVDAALGAMGKRASQAISAEMDKIQNLGHTTGSKLAIGAQVGFAGVGLNLFGDVQQGLSEVNTLSGKVGKDGQANMGMLQEGVYQLSREMGISQKDIIPGMYDAISAGIPQSNIFDFMETANKLAVGGVTDTQTAVDGLTTIVNAFGLDAEDAGLVADQMFTTVKNGKTTIEELSGAMFQVAPLANEAGIGLDQVNAAMGTLTLSGTPTSVAATQVRSAIQGLLRPSEDMTSIMNEAGYESAQAAIEQEGLAGALQIVSDATGGNQGEMIKLLGSIEAFQAATGVLSDDSAEYNRQLGEQQNALGATEDAYGTMSETQNKGLQDLKVAWENFAIVIGEAVAPMFNKLADIVGQVTDFFSRLPKPVQQGIAAFTLLATVLGPPLVMFYKYYKIWKLIQGLAMARTVTQAGGAFKAFSPLVSNAVSKVTGFGSAVKKFNLLKFGNNVMTGAKNAGAALTGGFKSALAGAKGAAVKAFGVMKTAAMTSYAFIMAHPFIAIGVAVAAIVTLIIMNWDKVKEWFMKFWNWFKSTFVFDWLLKAFNKIKDAALAIWTGIKTAWEAIWAVLQPAFQEIGAELSEFLAPVRVAVDRVTEAFRTFQIGVSFVFAVVKAVIAQAWEWIQEKFGTALTVISLAWSTFSTGFTTGVRVAFNVVKTIISTVWNAIKGIFNATIGVLSKAWDKWGKNLMAIAEAVWKFLGNTFKNAVDFIKNLVLTFLNILQGDWGEAWESIKGMAKAVWNQIKNIFSTALALIKNGITIAWDAIKLITSRVWNGIKAFISGVWNGMKATASAIFNGIKNTITSIFNTIKNMLTGTVNNIKTTVTSAFERMKSGVVGIIGALLTAIREIPGKVLSALGDLGSLLFDSGKRIIQGLINGIKNMGGAVSGAVRGVMDRARNLLPFSPAKEGPFAGKGWTLYSGESMMAALAEGIEREKDSVLKAMTGSMSGARQAIPTPTAMGPSRVGDRYETSNNYEIHINGTFDLTNPQQLRNAAEAIRQELVKLERAYA